MRFTFLNWRVNLALTSMAITSSAKKAIRASRRKRVFNLRSKSQVEKSMKAFRVLLTAKDKAGAAKQLPAVYKMLDKAAKTGYIKPNTSSRMKSRAAAALAKLGK